MLRKLRMVLKLSAEDVWEIVSGVPSPRLLSTLPLQLDGQAVELLDLRPEGDVWLAVLRPQAAPGAPEPTARRVPIAGLALVAAVTARAA